MTSYCSSTLSVIFQLFLVLSTVKTRRLFFPETDEMNIHEIWQEARNWDRFPSNWCFIWSVWAKNISRIRQYLPQRVLLLKNSFCPEFFLGVKTFGKKIHRYDSRLNDPASGLDDIKTRGWIIQSSMIQGCVFVEMWKIILKGFTLSFCLFFQPT